MIPIRSIRCNYAVEGTKDVRNLYSDQHKHSYDYSFGVRYELSLFLWAGLSISLYHSCSSMRIAIIPTIVWIVWMMGGFDELGILPSTTDQWMKAQDADNTYSSDLWKKGCKSELQLIRQGDEESCKLSYL